MSDSAESIEQINSLPGPGETFSIPNHGELVATTACDIDGFDAIRARAPNSETELYRVVNDDQDGLRVDYHKPGEDGRDWERIRRLGDAAPNLTHETARARLMDAVDAIADVQEGYSELTSESDEMLRDAKSSIAAVHFHADDQEVQFDL